MYLNGELAADLLRINEDFVPHVIQNRSLSFNYKAKKIKNR